MNTKLSIVFVFLTLAASVVVQAQNTEQVMTGSISGRDYVNLNTSRSFVNTFVNKYKFKKGVSIDDFSAYNAEVLPLSRIKRNVYKKSSSLESFKLFKNPFPVGPGKISVDKFGKVEAYSYIVSSAKDVIAIDNAYDDLLADVTKSVDPKYIVDIKDGIAISIPDSETVISIHKMHFGQWHAVDITFN